MTLTIFLFLMLTLFLIGVPVAYAILFSAFLYMVFATDASPVILAQRLVGAVESVSLQAVVFFIAAGVLMNYTGITRRLMNFAEVLTGHLPGGLAHVNVLLATLMGGISGSSTADAAMQAKMLVPEMTKKGYGLPFSTALTAAAAQITPIIPPGIALILYALIANVSVGKMFMAGVIPGLLLAAALMMTVHIIAKRKGYVPARPKRASMKEILTASRPALWCFLIPAIIIVGVRSGAFTPTEIGAVLVTLALVIGVVFYREMKWKDIVASLRETFVTSASVLIIIAAASGLGWVLVWERVPQSVAELATSIFTTPTSFLIFVNILLLILGMFLEGNVILIVLTPLFLPIITQLGIDPIHFGLVMILNLAIGTITPPFGTIMFLTCSVTGCRFMDFVKAVLPFLAALLAVLLLVTFIPQLATWLPNLLIG